MNKTFEYWTRRWLEFEKSEVKENTLWEYQKITTHLLNEFSGLDMSDITPKRIQALLDRMHCQNKAKSTINKRKYIIQQVFRYANIQGLEMANPCSFVKTPRLSSKKPRRALSQSEINIVMLHRTNFECGFYAYCLLMTGLRRSEMLALTWEDLDFEANLIRVCKAVNYIQGKPRIYESLKNGESQRFVPMPQELKRCFKIAPGKHVGLIFGASPDVPINANVHNWRWELYRRQTGLDITQHMLRHTYCTMLFDAEIDIKTAAYLMGHRDEHTTLTIYTHLEKHLAARKATGKLNLFINHPK